MSISISTRALPVSRPDRDHFAPPIRIPIDWPACLGDGDFLLRRNWSPFGPEPTSRDVRYSVVIGSQTDMKRTSQIGRS